MNVEHIETFGEIQKFIISILADFKKHGVASRIERSKKNLVFMATDEGGLKAYDAAIDPHYSALATGRRAEIVTRRLTALGFIVETRGQDGYMVGIYAPYRADSRLIQNRKSIIAGWSNNPPLETHKHQLWLRWHGEY